MGPMTILIAIIFGDTLYKFVKLLYFMFKGQYNKCMPSVDLLPSRAYSPTSYITPKSTSYITLESTKKKYQAHDLESRLQVGDWVQLEKCRPIDKTKNFLVVPLPLALAPLSPPLPPMTSASQSSLSNRSDLGWIKDFIIMGVKIP
ncbi:hypothetical protein V2J09_008214 [Rumex salicifolius]